MCDLILLKRIMELMPVHQRHRPINNLGFHIVRGQGPNKRP